MQVSSYYCKEGPTRVTKRDSWLQDTELFLAQLILKKSLSDPKLYIYMNQKKEEVQQFKILSLINRLLFRFTSLETKGYKCKNIQTFKL
jgi:hypothetical protein